VLVVLTLLAHGTQVVVLAHAALVTNSTDRVHTTAIALNVGVDSLCLLSSLIDGRKIAILRSE